MTIVRVHVSESVVGPGDVVRTAGVRRRSWVLHHSGKQALVLQNREDKLVTVTVTVTARGQGAVRCITQCSTWHVRWCQAGGV